MEKKFLSTSCDPKTVLVLMREMAIILACWAFVAYGYALTRPAELPAENSTTYLAPF